ncbi:MFS transporter [Sphingopyxis yananensis]|uniref:MFS transporter n=1 Tax=Sphingopyxis yananensis TaxID=2886687 RepID=UPI001D12A9D5|nr:MFS transporter [Sphingopyxis yananensis]MCC2602393.1 MFS transporter [Sphingopyxis yananensis]
MADAEIVGKAGTEKGAGWRNWLIAALLAACYTLSYIDRQIISLLIEPIKRSLELTDTQFGLMQGVSFSFFYVAASLPLAWLADRTRRSRLISVCVTFWSLMTMACAFAGNFWQMLAARIGIAAGESGLPPAALSTLADRFDTRRLATATSLFMLAPFLGGGFALAGGGALYAAIGRWDRTDLPIFSGLEDWQWVFLIVGAPGLIAALLLLLIRDQKPPVHVQRKGVGELVQFFRQEWRVAGVYCLAVGLLMTVLSSYVTWLPAAIMRSKGVDEATMGTLFGPIYLLAGASGTISAGILISLRGGTDPVKAILRYMLLMLALLWPIGAFGLLGSSFHLELALMGVALFLLSSVTSLSSLPFQYIAPVHLRAQALAVLAAVAAMFGTGLGPVLAGLISDNLGFADHPMSLSLSILAGAVLPIVMAMLAFTLRYHARSRLDLKYLA